MVDSEDPVLMPAQVGQASHPLMAHFYRAVVSHADVWRQRMDATTNWAAATTAGMLTFSFGAAGAPHVVLLLSLAFDVVFLLMESRRYQVYDLWRRRFRTLNRYLIVPVLVEGDASAPQHSTEEIRRGLASVAEDLGRTVPHLHITEAIGYRIRRNYGYIFLIVLLAWGLKLEVHPAPATSMGELVSRAAVGTLAGHWVVAVIAIFLVTCLVLAIRAPGERMIRWSEVPSPFTRLVPRSWWALLVSLGALAAPGGNALDAQVRRNEQERPPSMTIERYEPKSMLVVPQTPVVRARFPFVDVHGHQNLAASDSALAALVKQMDSIGLRTMVNLSGGSGERLAAQVRNARATHPGRFVVFANVDFNRINEPGFAEAAAAQLERDVRDGGAAGLKIFKNLGMDTYWADGSRVRTDDPRLAPIWDKAGELDIPVLIHTAEPAAFFEPLDEHNERYLELWMYPSRTRPTDKYPPFDTLMAEQHRMFKRHPRTTFISAHLSWLGQDLGRLGRALDSIPNMYVEVAAALYEIGRQPRAGRAFFERYQDRILMGKDTFGGPDEFAVYFRIFETNDEYFPWYRKRHAFWGMYGLGLPDDVLRKVYYENAKRIVPGIE